MLLTEEGKSKGCCFISYSDDESAQNALAANGEDMNGRSIRVEISKPRGGDSSGRGGRGGSRGGRGGDRGGRGGDRGRGRGGYS